MAIRHRHVLFLLITQQTAFTPRNDPTPSVHRPSMRKRSPLRRWRLGTNIHRKTLLPVVAEVPGFGDVSHHAVTQSS